MSYIVHKFKINLGYVAKAVNNNKEGPKDFPQAPDSILYYRILPFEPPSRS